MKRKWTYLYQQHKRKPETSFAGNNFFVPIVEKARKSIVSIETKEKSRTNDINDLFDLLFPGHPYHSQNRGFGSGFIFHPRGYILTSEHVIQNARQITVKLADGTITDAEKVWSDRLHDIAVLRIHTRKHLSPLPLGSSGASKVGEWVISIGNPLGLDQSVTTGIISGKNRPIRIADKVYEDIIQTDAAINPGNSGGPLINMRGEAIGMNAFIIKSNQGLGFAIGMDSIKSKIRKFLSI